MIFKITEKDLGVLKDSLKKGMKHTSYNSMCFSVGDIRRAEATVNDITKIMLILNENSINLFDGKDIE